MESDTRHAPLAAKEVAGFTAPVRITITSYRYRLCDIDGISGKAIIDGLVHCGVLQDDSPQHVQAVSFQQVKVKNKTDEKTVVRITEV